jgi:hypothetical protein
MEWARQRNAGRTGIGKGQEEKGLWGERRTGTGGDEV